MNFRLLGLLFALYGQCQGFNPPSSLKLSRTCDDLHYLRVQFLASKGRKFEYRCWHLRASEKDDFWTQQKALMEEMTGRAEKSLRQEQLEKFANRRSALISDTALFIALIFSFLWVSSASPFVSISYAFGAAFGLAYAYGLGKYVETIGGSADDTEAVQGAGIGQARFAFLIMLFILVGRFRSAGLIEIPSIAGFFTYQLASLSVGLREFDD